MAGRPQGQGFSTLVTSQPPPPTEAPPNGDRMKARPWSWRQAVAESDLAATTKHVLLTLSLFLSDVGEGVFPSLTTMAGLTSLSAKTVREHLQLARSKGWLDKESRFAEGGRQKSNLYVVKYPKTPTGPTAQMELRMGAHPAGGVPSRSR